MSVPTYLLATSDLLSALDNCWQFAASQCQCQTFDMHAAVAAIEAGQIRPDWNDGRIAPDDLLNAHAFGALISGEPSLWMQTHA